MRVAENGYRSLVPGGWGAGDLPVASDYESRVARIDQAHYDDLVNLEVLHITRARRYMTEQRSTPIDRYVGRVHLQ